MAISMDDLTKTYLRIRNKRAEIKAASAPYSGALVDQHALHIFNGPRDPEGFLGRDLPDDFAALRIHHAQNPLP